LIGDVRFQPRHAAFAAAIAAEASSAPDLGTRAIRSLGSAGFRSSAY
jgi:hypothetical protein